MPPTSTLRCFLGLSLESHPLVMSEGKDAFHSGLPQAASRMKRKTSQSCWGSTPTVCVPSSWQLTRALLTIAKDSYQQTTRTCAMELTYELESQSPLGLAWSLMLALEVALALACMTMSPVGVLIRTLADALELVELQRLFQRWSCSASSTIDVVQPRLSIQA